MLPGLALVPGHALVPDLTLVLYLALLPDLALLPGLALLPSLALVPGEQSHNLKESTPKIEETRPAPKLYLKLVTSRARHECIA